MASSVRHTNGDYLTNATLPTFTAAWVFGIWVKCNSGEYGGGGETCPFGMGIAGGSSQGFLLNVGFAANTILTVMAFLNGGSEIQSTNVLTGSDTGWIFVSIEYSGAGNAYKVRTRRENVTTFTTANLTMSTPINPAGGAIYVGTDQFSEHALDSDTRHFFLQATTMSDATLLTASQGINTAPSGTNIHWLRLLSAATANTNTGTAGNWATPTGTLQDAATEPTESSGGTNTPMTINVTQTQTASRARAVSPIAKSSTITQTLTRLRNAGLMRSVTETQSTSSGPASVLSGIGLTANQTQTATRVRAIGTPKSANEAQSPTRLRLVAPVAKTKTNAQTPSLVKGQGYLKTLTATITQTAALVRALGLLRSATQVQTLARAVAIARALSAVETQTKTIARAIATGRSITGTQTASLSKAVARLLAVTSTQTATRSRALNRALTAIATQTLSRVRALARALNVTNSETPTVQVVPSGGGPINYPMTLNATVAQTIALARACARPISTLQSQSITRARVLTLLAKSATQTQAPSAVKGQGYFKTLTSTVVQTAARVLGLEVARGATQTQAATATRGFAVTRTAIATQIANAARALGIRRAANQTQTPTLAKGRGFFVTLTAVAIQVATIVRNIGTTRFATQAHALDIQSEVAGGGFPILAPAPPKYTARGRDLRSAIYTTKGRSLRS